jgi:hypothetical protein
MVVTRLVGRPGPRNRDCSISADRRPVHHRVATRTSGNRCRREPTTGFRRQGGGQPNTDLRLPGPSRAPAPEALEMVRVRADSERVPRTAPGTAQALDRASDWPSAGASDWRSAQASGWAWASGAASVEASAWTWDGASAVARQERPMAWEPAPGPLCLPVQATPSARQRLARPGLAPRASAEAWAGVTRSAPRAHPDRVGRTRAVAPGSTRLIRSGRPPGRDRAGASQRSAPCPKW